MRKFPNLCPAPLIISGLQIRGDSMEPKISDGDVVIVRKQDDAESGNIVIATVNRG